MYRDRRLNTNVGENETNATRKKGKNLKPCFSELELC